MNTVKIAAAALMLALGGCATCRQHPTACGVAGAIVVTSIALSAGTDYRAAPRRTGVPSICLSNPAACQ
jgi:hypothetical protein